jgi:hypothetical protein
MNRLAHLALSALSQAEVSAGRVRELHVGVAADAFRRLPEGDPDRPAIERRLRSLDEQIDLFGGWG